jgi:hypothetical protein
VFLLSRRVLFIKGFIKGGYLYNLLDARLPGMWNLNWAQLEVELISGYKVISGYWESGLRVALVRRVFRELA